MFDFNNDEKTDSGEQFIGYQIFTDTTKGMKNKPTSTKGKVDWWNVFIIGLLIWAVLNAIGGLR